ncbi:MAG: hypothetical protein ACKOBG_03505 [Actinomycetota bacterium]
MAPVVTLDPCLGTVEARAMVELCHRTAPYRMYGDREQIDHPIARGLSQRQDALQQFVRSGDEHPAALATRTSYFREEFAYGTRELAPGVAPFLHHEGFIEAARAIHGRPVIEPAIVYGNLMVPGQEHATHTDVPEFRGANRKVVPQWLLVVMHHSGLFADHRMPIATGIAWFHDCDGGELSYWPDGPDGPRREHRVRYDTALVLDTDTVFHGVERIGVVEAASLPRIRPGTTLTVDGDRWVLVNGAGEELGRYDWSELRCSVSWKAYCFADERERDTWRDGSDDLTIDVILDRLVADLVDRGRVASDPERDHELGLVLTA